MKIIQVSIIKIVGEKFQVQGITRETLTGKATLDENCKSERMSHMNKQ